MKRTFSAAGAVLCIAGLTLSGCVSTQKYKETQWEVEALSMDKDKLAAQNADLTAQLAGVRKERDTLADQVVELKGKLDAGEGTASSVQSQLDEKDRRIEGLSKEIEDLNARIESLRKENEALKNKLAPSSGSPPATPSGDVPAPGAE